MSFDFIAPHYRWLESIAFANTLQRARINFIDQIPAPLHVLIAGEGDGRFLREFMRKFPKALVDCVDASARMWTWRARAQLVATIVCVFYKTISCGGRLRKICTT